MLSTGGLFQSGGSVRGVQVVLETHGLETGPLSDRAYAPRADLLETAPESAPAESLPQEAAPEALSEEPLVVADATPPQTPPEMPPETPLSAPEPLESAPQSEELSDANAADALPDTLEMPSQLETPRSLDPLPSLSQPDAPTAVPDTQIATAEQAPSQPAPIEPSQIEPVAPETVSDPVPVVTPPPPQPVEPLSEPTPTALSAFEPDVSAPPTAPEASDVAAPEAAAPAEPPVEQLDALLASLESQTAPSPPPVVRSFVVPSSETAPPDQPAATTPEPDDQPPEAAETPDIANEPDEPLSPLASATPPDAPDVMPQPDPTTQPGPIDWSAPFTPPSLDPRTVAQGNEAAQSGTADGLDAEIAAILSDISCGTLQANVGTDGQIDVRGFLTSSTEQSSVRDRLLGLGEVRAVADQDVVVVGEGLCDGLAAYSGGTTERAADAEVNEDLPPALQLDPLFGTVQGTLETFVGNSYLEIYVETPDYPSHVYIDYFRPDGTVIHLQPSELHPDAYQPQPASTIAISDMEPDGISVPAGPPFGLGMVVTLSANAPVFPNGTIRPREETAEEYLQALDVALRELEIDPEFKAQYGYVFVEVVRETADARQ